MAPRVIEAALIALALAGCAAAPAPVAIADRPVPNPPPPHRATRPAAGRPASANAEIVRRLDAIERAVRRLRDERALP